ncbi:MAG: NUDIX hydrolase [Pirellulales bacterium]
MHRQPLLTLFDRYEAHHPSEAPMIARVRTLVASHSDCFERTCLPGHITGSAWIVSADGERHLLVHHRKLNRWLQPGGHADGQTDVAAAALREAVEETGLSSLRFADDAPLLALRARDDAPLPLDVDVHVIPERLDTAGNLIDPAHEHHDIRFLLIAPPDEAIRVSDESHDVRWFTREEIERLDTDESVLRMLRKVAGRWQ